MATKKLGQGGSAGKRKRAGRRAKADAAGDIAGTLSSGEGSTECRAMEEALRDRTALLDATERLSGTGGWEWSIERQAMTWTNGTYRIHGMTPGEPAPGSPEHIERSAACYAPEDRSTVLGAFRRCAEQGHPYDMEVPFTSAAGRAMWVRTRAEAVWSGDRIVKVVGNIVDITERRRAEEALRNSERRFGALVAQSPLSVQILDTSGKTIQVNRAFEDLWGMSFEQTQDFNPLEDEQLLGLGLRPYLKRAFSGESVECPPTEYTPRAGDVVGRRCVVQTIAYPIKDESGAVREVTLIHQDITERKRAEKALREREERLRLVIAGTGVGTWDWNVQTGATVYDERWAEIAGYTLEELEPVSQQTWRDLVHPEDRERSGEALRRHLAGESEHYECEFRMKHKDGRWVCVHDRGMVVERTDDGKPLRISGTHGDITERRRAEEELRRAEERMELFFSQSLDGSFFRMLDEPVQWNDATDKEKVLDYVFAHQRITKVNDAMLAQYGATREQLTGLTPNDMFAHDLAYGRRVWRELFDAGRLHVGTDERKLDGTKMWIEGDYVCLRDSEGRITGHFGIQRDITEQRRAEEELRESEERFSRAFQTSPYAITITHVEDGKFVEINDAFTSMAGFTREEALANSSIGLKLWVNEEDRQRVVSALGAGRAVVGQEFQFRTKSGEIATGLFSAQALRLGKEPCVLSSIADITDRKRAEEALGESEERYRTLVECALDGIVIHVGDRVAFANRAAAAMLGLSGPAALVGQPLAGFVHPDDLASAEDRVRRVLAGEAVDYPVEVRYLRRDGTELLVENTGVLVTYQGKPAILSVIRDITERKQAEEALRESEAQNLALIRAFPDLLFTNRRDGEFLAVHTPHPEFLFASPETFLHRTVEEIIPKPLSGQFMKAFMNALDLGVVQELNYVLSIGGEDRNFEARVTACTTDTVITIVRDVTESKRVEEALKNSLSLVEATLESTDNGILVVSREGSVVKTNRRFAEMWRIPGEVLASGEDERLLGHVLSQLSDPDAFIAKVKALYADPGAESADLVHFKDGRVFERSSKPMLVGGEPKARVWSFLDVTERARAEQALRESEERHRNLVESSRDWVWETDANAVITFASAKVVDLLGYTPEEVVGRSAYDLMPPGDVAEARAAFGPFVAERKAFRGIENTNLHKNGRRVVLESNGVPVFDASGAFRGFRGMDTDITERKRAEEALRESEARYRRITEGLTDYQYTVRVEDGRAVETRQSPACASVTGYTGEELAADPYLWFRMVTPEDRDRVREHTCAILAGEDVPAIEHRIVRKDGEVRWVSDTAIPHKDVSGRLLSYDGVITDVTDRKRAEEALRIRDRAIATSFNGIVISDFDGAVTYANDAFLRMWGYTAPEALRLNVVDLGSDRDEVVQVVRDIKEKGFCVGESVGKRKDGSPFHHQFSASLVTSSSGAPIAMLSTFLDITERKRAEEELRGSEARLQSIFRVASTGIGVVRDRILLEVNAPVCEMTGRTREELIGKSARVFYPTREEFEYVGREKYRQIAEKGTGTVETRWMKKDGSAIDVLLSSTPIDPSDHSTGITFTALDITDRKRAEEALRQSENRLRSIFRVAPTGIGVIRDRILLEVNARICEMTGYTREELIGKSARVYYPTQEEFEHVGQEKRRQMAERGIDVIETRWMNKDGSIVDVLLSSAPIDATDPGMGDIFTALDITERKRTEEALRGSEERYRALFENSAVAIGMRSPDGGYLECNSAYLEMLGYTREELLSRRTADVTHPEDVEISRSNMAAVAEGRATSRRYEKRYVHKNGSVVWGDVCIRPLRDGDGKVVAIVGAVVDITERKEAEESLRLRSLALNAAANAVIITDREGGIEWVNLAFLALTGYREDEVIGRNPRVLTKSGMHGRAFYADLWDTVLAGDVWHGELTNRRKDGSVYSEEMTITPLRDERGEINHFIAVKQDITEQKLLQAEFVQSQKMESVGRLAGGIAHDFNNLLSVINGYAELAVADRSLSTPLRAQIVAIHRAGERAATLTRQLLAFSRRQTVEPVVLDLNDAIRAVQKMLERLIGEDITLVFAPTEPLGRVRADPGQLEQVMMNLVINARDAMPAGGMLGIETANVELDREAAERVSVKPGSYVMLAISDIGMGMDEVTREHIFEPFFTTKGSGKGTGLGLAIVYGIVQQFGGGIQVTSTVGQGTTFSIYLPWVETPVSEEAATPPAPAEAVGGTETILVVEDDESLRTMAADVLASVGYTVLQARHGEEALQVLARHGEPVHLVFTDMVMPGMGGLELAEEIGKTQPQTKVLFTSGFASDATAGRVAPEVLTHFICKPYSVVQLARKVREVLDWLW
jgi:PAS domain S-box-containing protein